MPGRGSRRWLSASSAQPTSKSRFAARRTAGSLGPCMTTMAEAITSPAVLPLQPSRGLSHEQCVSHQPEGMNICGGGEHRARPELLRCHVERGPQAPGRPGPGRALGDQLGHPEVEDLDPGRAVLAQRQKEVLLLQIPVNDRGRVRPVERPGRLLHVRHHLARRQAAQALEPLAELLAAPPEPRPSRGLARPRQASSSRKDSPTLPPGRASGTRVNQAFYGRAPPGSGVGTLRSSSCTSKVHGFMRFTL